MFVPNVTINGFVSQIGSTESFQSKSGNTFVKRSVILEIPDEKYANNIYSIEFFGDKIGIVDSLKEGQYVSINCLVKGRESKGKYFVSLSGVDVGRPNSPAPGEPLLGGTAEESFDDTPF